MTGITQSASAQEFAETGRDDLSYYIKKGDAPAERIRKKDFKDKIHELFGDCPTLEAELNKDYSWTQLPKYVYEHANCGG